METKKCKQTVTTTTTKKKNKTKTKTKKKKKNKTSLIRRYTEGIFTPNYKLTIGVDFAVKTILYSDQTVVNLQLWFVFSSFFFLFLKQQ